MSYSHGVAGVADWDGGGRQPARQDGPSHLLVEGLDDFRTVLALTQRRAVGWTSSRAASPWFPFIKDAGGKPRFPEALRGLLKQPAPSRVGVILDADGSAAASLEKLRKTLEVVGDGWQWVHPMVPRLPDPAGIVLRNPGVSPSRGERFGIWIMPDNQSSGALEDFLRPLVPEGDELWKYSERATDGARTEARAKFPDTKRSKAVLRAWLAWQEKPGQTYELAIKDGAFGDLRPDRCATVDRFMTWFEVLFSDDRPGVAATSGTA